MSHHHGHHHPDQPTNPPATVPPTDQPPPPNAAPPMTSDQVAGEVGHAFDHARAVKSGQHAPAGAGASLVGGFIASAIVPDLMKLGPELLTAVQPGVTMFVTSLAAAAIQGKLNRDQIAALKPVLGSIAGSVLDALEAHYGIGAGGNAATLGQ